MQTAQQAAAEQGNVNIDSAATLATVTVNGTEYDFRVCGSGPEAFFEWINDGGDPIGDIRDEVVSVEAEKARFELWRVLDDAHSESEEEGPNGFLLSFDKWVGKASADPYHQWHQQAKAYLG